MDTADREEPLRAAASRRYWDRKTAEAVLAELEASGECVAQFGRRLGLPGERLRRWRRVLSAEKSAAGPVWFHPVVRSQGQRAGPRAVWK